MKEKEITKTELAQRMDRDAKAFYKRYTAGLKILDDDRMLLTTFGVFLHNEYFAAAAAREARLVEALEAEVAAAKEGIDTLINACGQSYDCSRDPGHTIMNAAITGICLHGGTDRKEAGNG